MTLEFGRWRLEPMDSNNWELCHWHAATRGKNAGTEQWNRLGRYYQCNTFANAILYAADQEMRDGGKVVDIKEFIERYGETVRTLKKELADSLAQQQA